MIRLHPAQFMAVIAAAWGSGVLAGGQERFNMTVSHQLTARVAPWWVWGVFFLLYAVALMTTETARWHWAVVLFGAIPYAVVVASYWTGAMATETVTLAGVSVYTAMWMIHVGIAVTLFMNYFRDTEWYKEHVG